MTKEELAFIEKGRTAGFRIINHEGLEKIEINLQSPIKLLEDFELLEEFNHLVYYCVEPFSMEEIEDTQLHDIFVAEQIIDGESYQMMKKRLRLKLVKRMKKLVRTLRIRSGKVHKTKHLVYHARVMRYLRYKKKFFTF